MIRINIIGAGRVGQTLIELINPLSAYSIQTICSSRFSHDSLAVVKNIDELPAADLFFLTVPDHAMEQTAKTVCQHHRDTMLAHCSGSLPSSLLNPDKRDDIQVVSVHPPISIVDPKIAAAKFNGGVCTIEGDTPAVASVTALFESFGTEIQRIDPSQKPAYHSGNAIAANYLVTLADAACQQLKSAGLNSAFAKRIVEQLAQSVLDNLKSKESFADALTGPIVRNDQQVVQDHLAATKPELKHLYSEMGKQTLKITPLSAQKKTEIKQLLDRPE